MNRFCADCGHHYDDVNRSTQCPHSSVDYANTLCIVHDLHDCHVPVAHVGRTAPCQQLANIVEYRIHEIYGEDDHAVHQWMHRRQALLQMKIPREMIARGEIDRVLQVVDQLRDGAFV